MLDLPARPSTPTGGLPVSLGPGALPDTRATTATRCASRRSGAPELAHYLGWLIGDGCTSGDTTTTIYGSAEDREEVLPRHAELARVDQRWTVR